MNNANKINRCGLIIVSGITTIIPLWAIYSCPKPISCPILLFILSLFSTSIFIETLSSFLENSFEFFKRHKLDGIVKALFTSLILYLVITKILPIISESSEFDRTFVQVMASIVYGLDIRRYIQTYFENKTINTN